jgi:Trans-aconitate methyltransferase
MSAPNYSYQEVYEKSDSYYWGVKPSYMCLEVIKLMPPDRPLRVLDIGCGEGKNAVFFARCGYDVSAFDIASSGVEKTKRLAEKAGVHVNAFEADVLKYRLDNDYDILFSSGVLHYIKPELRDEIFENYRTHTSEGGINAMNVFVQKPFVASAPERETNSHHWLSGELLTFYHDWLIEDFSEVVFDCNSSGVPHKHAMNTVYARRKI